MAKPLTGSELMNLDPNFVYEVALGLEEGKDIAPRYDIAPAQWDEIRESKYFKLQVSALRAEMERNGTQFGTMAGVMAYQLLKLCFQESMQPDMELKNRLEALKQLARYANFEPKGLADIAAGPKFSISISIPSALGREIEVVKAVDDPKAAVEVEEAAPQLTLNFGPGGDKNDEKTVDFDQKAVENG